MIIKPVLRRIYKLLPESNRLERIWLMAKFDFKLRYYDSLLGLIWAFLNPLSRLLIYYFIFTIMFQQKQENYGLYIYSGLIVWLFFSELTNRGIMILKTKDYLMMNIPMNRFNIYLTSLLTGAIGLGFNLFVFFWMGLLFGVYPTWNYFLAPLVLFNLFLLVTGVNMILSVMRIYFKDITHIWEIALLLGFWITPIFYRGENLIEIFPPIVILNPLVLIVENMRELILLGKSFLWSSYFISLFSCGLIFVAGQMIFLKYSSRALEVK